MIHLDKVEVKEASRVWADFVEKQAFELNVNGTDVLGALAGTFAGMKAHDHFKNKRDPQMAAQFDNATRSKKLEGTNYENIQTILQGLKIVFTPINVVFSVNGQVFEIIKSTEMSPEMKERFLVKDGEYFKQLLVNKMNMELQMAEQIFARKLLQPHLPDELKEATFTAALMEKVSKEGIEVVSLEKTASVTLSIPLPVSFDSIRPFEKLSFWFGKEEDKGPKESAIESFSADDMHNKVKVAFLPDRVVFVLNGNLVEQMTVMQMNEEGYAAFQKKDSEFFLTFFHNEAKKINEAIFQDVSGSVAQKESIDKQADEDDDKEPDDKDIEEDEKESDDDEKESDDDDEDDIDKEAASLEEVIASMDKAWIEDLAVSRDVIEPFYDADIHPIVYDIMLDKKINKSWHKLELEAALKEIEVTYELTESIGDRALDKIAMLHAIQNEEHSVFDTAFSFEKFLRAMNSKSVLITTFEGGMEFEEIIFALDIAKSVCGSNVFAGFGRNIAPYVAEELFQDNIRFVSDQVYDELNASERDFWNEVNSFLMRKWKERDCYGLESTAEVKRRSEQIVEIGNRVLSTYAEYLDIESPYESTRETINQFSLLQGIEETVGVEQAVVQTTSRHLICALFLEVKREEARQTVERLVEGE